MSSSIAQPSVPDSKPSSFFGKLSQNTGITGPSTTQPSLASDSTSASGSKSVSLFGNSSQNSGISNSSDTSKGFAFNFKASPSTPLTPGFAAFTSGPFGKTGDSLSTSSSPASKTISTGNLGNPVGFGFGGFSGASKGGTKLLTTEAASTTEALVPSQLPTTEIASRTDTLTPSQSDAAEEGSQATEEPHEPTTSTDVNPYDAAGAGEEEETTVFETKAKAYRMSSKEGKVDWINVGTGNYVLQHKLCEMTSSH
jgi:hypothetical protein